MFVLEKQVVVLKVSLHCHCQGCEGKVKKHLSRIQGQSLLIDNSLTEFFLSKVFLLIHLRYSKMRFFVF